jgi:hypothetical protein
MRRKPDRVASLCFNYFCLVVMMASLCLWLYSFAFSPSANHPHAGGSLRKESHNTVSSDDPEQVDRQKLDTAKSHFANQAPVLLTTPELCTVTADVRGNLGLAAVTLNNGTDWLKDRWQAASDMGGTAIRGRHWVQLDFADPVVLHSARLDWETAYSDHYELLIPLKNGAGDTAHSATNHKDPGWTTVFTAPNERIQVNKTGTSPGFTKVPMPLHVVHTFELEKPTVATKSVRLLILSSATGWGVSLWRIEIYGTHHRTQ